MGACRTTLCVCSTSAIDTNVRVLHSPPWSGPKAQGRCSGAAGVQQLLDVLGRTEAQVQQHVRSVLLHGHDAEGSSRGRKRGAGGGAGGASRGGGAGRLDHWRLLTVLQAAHMALWPHVQDAHGEGEAPKGGGVLPV